MLCEANQWPDDVVQYFGDPATGGDECHMAFHFPVMPRIFMARAPRVALPDLGNHGADAVHSRLTASGAYSCAIMTS